MTMSEPLKVLIAAHSHPQFTNGGAEIASYQLYADLKSRSDYRAWFLGCIREPKHQRGATFSQPFGPDEFLYEPGAFDWFKFANPDPKFPGAFRELLRTLSPDVVHLNHYAVFGLETLLHIRRTIPNARIVLTLHEFLAICNHFGQMVTRGEQALCHRAGFVRCTSCFPEIAASDFFLRDRYIRRFFDLVDHFISPSRFLADRYVDWGLPTDRLSVIENLIPAQRSPSKETRRRRPGPLRVGFFGQISTLKGIHVLLDAAEILDEADETDVSIEVFGDHRNQPPELQSRYLERISKLGRNVRVRGPYEPERVDELMRQVDVVVAPSTWWENSPVVIEEALRNRRPVICSDIGGMAEKVRDGVDGIHFPMGDPTALAALLSDLAANRDELDRIASTMRPPPDAESVVTRHRAVYEGRPLSTAQAETLRS